MRRAVLKAFIHAFNIKDIKALSQLLDVNIEARSSSDKKIRGKDQVVKVYQELMDKYGAAARYGCGVIDNNQVVVVWHRQKDGYKINAVKMLKVRRGKVKKILSSRDPKLIEKIEPQEHVEKIR